MNKIIELLRSKKIFVIVVSVAALLLLVYVTTSSRFTEKRVQVSDPQPASANLIAEIPQFPEYPGSVVEEREKRTGGTPGYEVVYTLDVPPVNSLNWYIEYFSKTPAWTIIERPDDEELSDIGKTEISMVAKQGNWYYYITAETGYTENTEIIVEIVPASLRGE